MNHILWSDQYLEPGDDQEVEMQYSDKGAEGKQRALWETVVYPLGNGRLGCTLFGGPQRERIQFNEDSLWVGNEHNTGGYQPFGDLFMTLDAGCGVRDPEVSDYRRELDIERAVQTITYRSGGVYCKRECFSSWPAQVIAFRLSADRAGALSGQIEMTSLHPVEIETLDGGMVMTGNTRDFWFWRLQLEDPGRLLGSRDYASDEIIDLDFEARLRVLHEGGTAETKDGKISFENCDTVTLLLAAGTNYLNKRQEGWHGEHPHDRLVAQITAAEERGYDELLREHVEDYQALYNRVAIDLGETPPEITSLATDARVKRYGEDCEASGVSPDRELEVQLYQYARYLMISSSRPGYGALPANLQGLWLMNKHPAWRCDYHTDVNVQMNYWFADAANIGECYLPLAEWVDSIREVRKEETRKVLGVERGWLMRSENGIFGGSTYHFQKGDSAWVCQNLWDHYAFTGDKAYLERYAYPIMKEISEFWVDHLKELAATSTGSGQAGTLVAPDGRSPEHGPAKADGVTYDQCLCWDLFTNTIEASEALGVDAAFRKELIEKRAKLLGPQIGKWGQFQEWMEDIDDPEDDHRHINFLIGVYPGRQVHPSITPEFAEAARVIVTARRDHGPGHPGWSRVWKACIFARLLDGEAAYGELANMMTKKLYGNMWTTHPPFQIDCNFGYAAGVHEMLVQSHLVLSIDDCRLPNEGATERLNPEQGTRLIHLLPALPEAWETGSVTGIRARGGYELDLEWQDGELMQAVIRGAVNCIGEVTVRYGDESCTVKLAAGESRRLGKAEFGQSSRPACRN